MSKINLKRIFSLFLVLFLSVPLSIKAEILPTSSAIIKVNKVYTIKQNTTVNGVSKTLERTVRTYTYGDNSSAYKISAEKIAVGEDKAPTSYRITSTTPNLKYVGVIQYGKKKGYSDLAIQIALNLASVFNEESDDEMFTNAYQLYIKGVTDKKLKAYDYGAGQSQYGTQDNQLYSNDNIERDIINAFEIYFYSSTIKLDFNEYSSTNEAFICTDNICYYPGASEYKTISDIANLKIPKSATILDVTLKKGSVATIAGDFKNKLASDAKIKITVPSAANCEDCAYELVTINYSDDSVLTVPKIAYPNSSKDVQITNSSNMLVYENSHEDSTYFSISSGEGVTGEKGGASSAIGNSFTQFKICGVDLIVEGGYSKRKEAFTKLSLEENLNDPETNPDLRTNYTQIFGKKACNGDNYLIDSTNFATYNVSGVNNLADNRYCRIYCKEDLQINTPQVVQPRHTYSENIFAGRFFVLQDLVVETKKTCTTVKTKLDENGKIVVTDEPGINLSLFYRDLYNYTWEEGDPIPSTEQLIVYRNQPSGGGGGGGGGSDSRLFGLTSLFAKSDCAKEVLKSIEKALRESKQSGEVVITWRVCEPYSYECGGRDGSTSKKGYYINGTWVPTGDAGCSGGYLINGSCMCIKCNYVTHEVRIPYTEYTLDMNKTISSGMSSTLERYYPPNTNGEGIAANETSRQACVNEVNAAISELTKSAGFSCAGSSCSFSGESPYKIYVTPANDADYNLAKEHATSKSDSDNPCHDKYDVDSSGLCQHQSDKDMVEEMWRAGKFEQAVGNMNEANDDNEVIKAYSYVYALADIDMLQECSLFFKNVDYDYKPEVTFKYCDEYEIEYTLTGKVSDDITLEYCASSPNVDNYECLSNKMKIKFNRDDMIAEGSKENMIKKISELAKANSQTDFLQDIYYLKDSNGNRGRVKTQISVNLGTKVEYTAKWTANTTTVYYSSLPNGVARTIPLEGRSIKLNGNGLVYPLNIKNDKKICEYSFEFKNLGERRFETCYGDNLDEALVCKINIPNEIVSPETNGINYFYRPININDVFMNETRSKGSNWINEKGIATTKEIEENNDTIYAENTGDSAKGVQYSYTITPTQAYKIRKYNNDREEWGGYADFDLKCNEKGLKCVSSFLSGEMVGCEGDDCFTDNLSSDPTARDTDTFCSWYIEMNDEMVEVSWKGKTSGTVCTDFNEDK